MTEQQGCTYWQEIVGRAIINLPPDLRTADPNDGIRRLREIVEEQRAYVASINRRETSLLRTFTCGMLAGLVITVGCFAVVSTVTGVKWQPIPATLELKP